MGCNLCFSIISIHAPTRGATYQQVHFTVAYIIFQSTLPREERLRQTRTGVQGKYFNPRSHERSDLCRFGRCRHDIIFQSTLPREERHLMIIGTTVMRHFNPRSHERSDFRFQATHSLHILFQSTLPREERQQYCTKNLFIFIQYRQ